MRRATLAFVLLSALLSRPLHAGEADAIALVNGKPVTRQAVVNLLLESHGIDALQQLVLLELARQEAERAGVKVSAADVQREYDRSVEKLAAAANPGQQLDAALRQRALEAILAQKGISHAEFRISMERNAYLRKLVEGRLEISESTLREEFARTHGARVVVRDIVLADTNELTAALQALNQGGDFADVARRYSRHPSAANGGQLPAFAFNDDAIPPLVREAAFGLQPGEVSAPLRVEERFHVLKLEQRLAPESVRFEDVRSAVAEQLRERVVPQEMGRLAAELFEKAAVKVLEPGLKGKFDELRQRAAQAASAGSAGSPASP